MKLVMMAVASAALVATAAPAFAVAAGGTTSVALSGHVPSLCGAGNQSGGGARTPGSDTVNLGSLVDGNGFLSVADQDIAFDNLWCNAPSTLTMTVTSLSTSTAVVDQNSFVNHLDVTIGNDGNAKILQTYFQASSVSSATNGGVLTAQIPAAFETGTGQYSKAAMHISLPAGTQGNDRPVAGDYAGTVTITATPQ